MHDSGPSLPNQGWNLGPLQWKRRVSSQGSLLGHFCDLSWSSADPLKPPSYPHQSS